MIHHLCHPEGGLVNDFIDPEMCSVQYTKFDEAIKMIQNLGPGTTYRHMTVKK